MSVPHFHFVDVENKGEGEVFARITVDRQDPEVYREGRLHSDITTYAAMAQSDQEEKSVGELRRAFDAVREEKKLQGIPYSIPDCSI